MITNGDAHHAYIFGVPPISILVVESRRAWQHTHKDGRILANVNLPREEVWTHRLSVSLSQRYVNAEARTAFLVGAKDYVASSGLFQIFCCLLSLSRVQR